MCERTCEYAGNGSEACTPRRGWAFLLDSGTGGPEEGSERGCLPFTLSISNSFNFL